MFDIPPHPNVVGLLGACESPPAMVVELVHQARELDDYLEAFSAVETPLRYLGHAVELLTDIARGMEHLHGSDVVHRDLAPRNVLVDRERRARVNDFGLSRNVAR